MEFIHFETDDSSLNLEDDDELIFSPQNDNLIDDDSVQEEDESPSICRFVNQMRNLDEALDDDNQ